METQQTLTPILSDIHRYWFGELKSPADLPGDKMGLWFTRSDETDTHIRDTFGRYIPEAAAIDWDLNRLTREEQVALVVLLDQFPRNIFRGSGESFVYDGKAREVSRNLLIRGKAQFFLIEQVFLYVPFEHSEEVADQDFGVMLAAELAVSAPPGFVDYARDVLDYFTRHRDVIRKFGRFPHRNALLGRQSTAEEKAYLAEHPHGF